MIKKLLHTFCVIVLLNVGIWAQTQEKKAPTYGELLERIEKLERANAATAPNDKKTLHNLRNRFRLGAYGEAVFSRNFYSNNWKRYSQPDLYKNEDGHGRVDIPHFVLMLDYNFGKGWKFSTELEFEHGGVGTAVEIEEEETGEYESEVEKGGEFVIEQMWLEKSFSPSFNIRMGHIVVPVGGTNKRHLPTEFFGNYRPEGESTMLPCTWHQTGVSLWGKTGDWRYEAQFLPGLDAFMFDDNYWIGKGATSPFEFKIANSYAGMLRIDNYSIAGLQLGLSAYIGKSGVNSLKQDNYKDIDGIVSIAAFDFVYDANNWIVRGSADYGTLTDSDKITAANISNRKDSPSPKDKVAKSAANAWIEAGYNVFSFSENAKLKNQKLYVFGRYNFYDTMFETEESIIDDKRFRRNCYAFGINYFPLKEIVIKAEYTARTFEKPYNTESAFNIGVAFSGLFIK